MIHQHNENQNWSNATWEGGRRSSSGMHLIRDALKLSYAQRFQAIEEISETSVWLAQARPFRKADTTRAAENS